MGEQSSLVPKKQNESQFCVCVHDPTVSGGALEGKKRERVRKTIFLGWLAPKEIDDENT